jgi:hypothetical protein
MLPGANFCPRCGTALRPAPPPPAQRQQQVPRAVSLHGAHPDAESFSTGGFVAVVGSVIAAGLGVMLLIVSQGNDALLLMVGLFLLGISLAALATAVSCVGAGDDPAGDGDAPARRRHLTQSAPGGLREQPLQPRRLGHP